MRQPSAQIPFAQPDRLAKIEAFSIDEGQPSLSFARRLARENGWTVAYAERVIREYKRFVYLAVVAGHVVSPSEDVDQAWHLHLTYTRSYWKRFCRETLGIELHHDPTRGGPAEAEKHERLYTATLASYEQHFGEAPPADIWPDVEERFATAGQARWVDPARFWVVRKPWSNGRRRPLIAVAVVGLCPIAAALNPLDFDGPTFLAFYAVVAGAALVAGLLVRFLAGRSEERVQAAEVADPYEAAYLANGPSGLVQGALTALAQRKNLTIADGTLSRGPAELPTDAAPVERSMYEAVPEEGATTSTQIGKALAAARAHAGDYRDRLRAAGLVYPDREEPLTKRWLPAMVMAVVTLLGVLKIAVGISRDRPVAFLVLMTIATAVAAILFLLRGRRTPRGTASLGALKSRHQGLTTASAAALSPLDAALLAGLFGTTYLAGSELMPFHDLRQKAEAASGGGGGCAGSSCGGGGDGGGGGCGGGGCGGCGGGGD